MSSSELVSVCRSFFFGVAYLHRAGTCISNNLLTSKSLQPGGWGCAPSDHCWFHHGTKSLDGDWNRLDPVSHRIRFHAPFASLHPGERLSHGHVPRLYSERAGYGNADVGQRPFVSIALGDPKQKGLDGQDADKSPKLMISVLGIGTRLRFASATPNLRTRSVDQHLCHHCPLWDLR